MPPKIERATVNARPNSPKSEPAPAKPPVGMPTIYKPGTASHLKLVLFGPPGTGKTTGALSGSGRKLLILTEPDGDQSVAGRDDIDVVAPTSGPELQAVINALHGGLVQEYDRVVLDSVTFAFEVVGRKSLGAVLEAGRDPRHVYGQIGASVTQMIHDIVALPTHVVFTTQMKSDFMDDEDPDAAGPEEGKFPFTMAITPMVYKVLAPAVGTRGRTYKKMFVDAKGNKKARYLVSFDDYGKSPAGTRIAGLPDTVEDLDVDVLIELMQKGAGK
jgi:hypothetical protein